ncbi:MAG: hypothetical protein GQ564_23805 [Bacteroidales bacterium]|nr:hypothetical protein [Bacteroidales bacterium]
MHTSITKEQLVNFVFNDVNEEERKNITEAINTNPVTKERYLYEKRKIDVERYVNDEMDIGESCEIEELIKMDSRLYDHFELNTEPIDEVEKDVSINFLQIAITNEQLVNFILNDVYEKEYKKISEAINTNSLTKERYLFEKRKFDVERYLDDKMDFGESCEIEELLKINSRLYEYCESIKDLNDKEQNVSINLKHFAITEEQLVNFVLNDVNDQERKKISEAINTKTAIKERYLFEKRKHDVEKYIDDKMDIGERCETEERLKMDSRLFDHFELNDGVIEEEQDESISLKQIPITNEQLVNFVLNDLTEEEHKKISEAINTNPVTKERYLFEKRKYDVERYIDDEMDIGERCEIEELIKMDSRLYEHFELNKDVIEFLEIGLKKQINDIHAELYDAIHNDEADRIEDEVSSIKDVAPVIKLKPGILSIGKWVAAASIIITIGLSGVNTYLNNRGSLENRLYAKYFEPFNNDDDQYYSNSVLFDAKKQYSNKKYDLVLMLLDDSSNSVTIESEKLLYQGLALMELERCDEAIEKLKQLQNAKTYKSIQFINNWYLSLCYLKTGKNEQAIEQLEKITNNNTYFYKEAKELLKKLKK